MTRIDKLTGFTGAEIRGLDLRVVDDETATTLLEALAAHHVVIVRDQNLSLGQQKAVTEVFGPLATLPYIDPLPDDAQVIAVLKEAHETDMGVFGGDWHSDFSFLANPPAGSVLAAVELPPHGGDTVWANQVAAHRTLPRDLRDAIDGTDAVHVGKPYGVRWAPPEEERSSASIGMRRGDPDADENRLHPTVITVPETDEQALFVNPIYTTRLAHLSESESAPILDELYRHATRPDFSYRHRWEPGDVAIWNNRTTMHYATNDYDGHRRLLHRTTFAREAPRR
ncbi:MAG: TauD/TfdA family dioxygenase [Actinomycetota bacterium]